MKLISKYIYITLVFSLLFPFSNAFAAGLVPNCAGSTCTVCNFLQLISNIAYFIVKDVMPPLAGLLFLIGGIIMIASAGSEERYKKGKKVIVNTGIGVVIVLTSWVIVNTLITTLGKSSVAGMQVQNWWQPPNCGGR